MAEFLNQAGNPLAALTRLPGMRQLLVLIGLAASIAIGVTAAFWMREPAYSTLYGNLSGKEASEVVNVLTAAAIPYQLDDVTGAVTVPAGKLHEARLKLAEQGLPKGSGFGLEIIQGDSTFATSQFIEGARYHHALETELARTIGSLQPVQSARVHLAMPKSTVFLGNRQQPSASVLLQLYAGRKLTEPQVAAIVHLVAASIPELDAGRVTVVDQTGRLLNAPEDGSALGGNARQLEYVRKLEQGYVERIENLLVPMLGAGRVRTTVTADVDFTQREETQELYDPETIVRSEQVAEDRQSGNGLAGGIPGALSNQPPAPVPAPQAPAPAAAAGVPANAVAAQTTAQTSATGAISGNESVRRTRNFEMDRTLSHTKQAQGTVRRLSVAVLVDERRVTGEDGQVTAEKLAPAEIEELTRLVRDAVGFDTQRGDSLSVSNIGFYQAAEAPAEEPGMLASPAVRTLGKQGLAAALILAVALVLVRPLLRALGGGAPVPGQPALAMAGAGGAGLPAGMVPEQRAALSFDDKVSVARQLADRNPERVAQIVRAWVQADE